MPRSLLPQNYIRPVSINRTAVPNYVRYQWKKINSNGFGDTHNISTICFAEHNGYFYVGTYRTPSFVVGAEVWRTAIGSQQSDWAQVNADGFGNNNNNMIAALYSWEGYLYAGTWNVSTGAEVWRSQDGISWEQVNTNGFGLATNQSVQSFCEFNGKLYCLVMNLTQGQSLWRISNGISWSSVMTNGWGVGSGLRGSLPSSRSMIVFNDYLYASAYSTTIGGRIYRTQDVTNWTVVCDAGLGLGSHNFGIQNFGIFGGYLYGVMANQYSTEGSSVWRTSVGSQQSDWTRVTNYGIGNLSNKDGFGLVTYKDSLYVSQTQLGKVPTIFVTNIGSQQSDWVAQSYGLGGSFPSMYEVFDFIEFNGYLYAAGCCDINGQGNNIGASVYRLGPVTRTAI